MSSPSSPPPLNAHLRAALGLFVGFFFLCAGTPGVRSIGPKFVEKKRDMIEEKAGFAAPIMIGLIEANFKLRVPIAKHFLKFQSVFRIAQNWGLYGSGPSTVRHLQIDVDGAPVYRTNDPDLTWLAPQLSHRKIRPMPETMVTKDTAFNWTGFSRFVVDKARADFPEAKSVTILAFEQTRKEGARSRIQHGRRAQAPDWSWQFLGKDGEPVAAPVLEADDK